MKTSMKDNDLPSFSIASEKGLGPLAFLYKNVLSEFKETKNSRNYGKLWSNIAPSGNIYRYLGLSQERLKHCWDIRRQLAEVAESKKELLGAEKSENQRIDLLLSALNDTKSDGGIDPEAGDEPLKGFLPLQEFGNDEVGCALSFYYPQDTDAFSSWRFNHFLAFLVFAIQTLGVSLLLVQLWYGDDNQLKNPKILWKHITVKELMCLGKDTSAALTTVAGVMFILLVYSIVYLYAKGELEDVEKNGRLPANKFWSVMSLIANSMAAVVVLLAIPMELWSEDGIVGIMMNAMAMLFVFTLDDLTGDAFGYLSTDDNDFAKEVCWHFALLSYCPISIRDLIDDSATDPQTLWKIKYAANGTLVSALSGEPCKTRIMDITPEATENSPLVKEELDEGDTEDLVLEYTLGEFASKEQLPGLRAQVTKVHWWIVTLLIKLLWVVVPIIWFIVNKPCSEV
jgi:hypothetical protein